MKTIKQIFISEEEYEYLLENEEELNEFLEELELF